MPRLALAVCAAVVLLVLPAPAPAAAAEEIPTSAASTYQVVPSKGQIRVTVTQRIRNRTPSTTSSYDCSESYFDYWYGLITIPKTCTSTTRYFVNETHLWVEAGASN
jgi:hypothetical protein